ncbi:MAG: Ti-type conjugative transfer relaxase TraA, partial [Alphaproteobacteria bacterium]|nr:Ti-type conjugative transfer relaxase TraA [Alphaproteobacteria bacterium]
YNQIDHGYAATNHKSQGMTIDRSHMLATTSMDRHSTYVALSRHREDTSLHYGRDDFADTNLLARTLSRERAKDMASDYARGVEVEAVRGQEGSRTRAGEREPAQSFAARREIKSEVIRLPEQRQPIIEPPRKEPVKARSIFASFKPPVVTPERDIAARELRSPSVAPELKRAVEKYARTLSDISAMKERGLSVLPHQEQARDRAHDALNKIQPHAGRDAARVFRNEPELVSQAASGKSTAAMRSMQLEREIQSNPQMRADRFVENWQKLSQQRDSHYRSGNYQAREKITDQMHGFAKSLERDPQMESVLRNRKVELGLQVDRGGTLSHNLADMIGRGLGRGLGL